MSYNPLHDALLTSSVLSEGPDVVAIWAIILSSAGSDGVSIVTAPYCASVLRISIERASAAFKVLSSPDANSRTKAHEGRRIVPIDSGWWLPSHLKWRAEAKRLSNAERQRRFRAKLKAQLLSGFVPSDES